MSNELFCYCHDIDSIVRPLEIISEKMSKYKTNDKTIEFAKI